MPLVDVATLRSLIQTDLADSALTFLEAQAESEITERWGTLGANVVYTKEFNDDSEITPNIVFLDRKASVIVDVTEYVFDFVGETPLILNSDDYRILYGGYALERIGTGADLTHQYWTWGRRVQVTYTPVDDTDRRKGVIVELVRLGTRHSGVQGQTIGDYSDTQYASYVGERKALIESLNSGLGVT